MKSLDELKALRDRMKQSVEMREDAGQKTRIVVGMGTCGIAAGARPVLAAFVDEVTKQGVSGGISVGQTGCIGLCDHEPVVEVFVPGKEKVTYVEVTPQKVAQIVDAHIVHGEVVPEFTVGNIV